MSHMGIPNSAAKVLSGLLQSRTGQVLSDARMWRLDTSLQPVMRRHDIANLDALVERLMTGNAKFTDEVVDALLNNESSFFRDPQIFNVIFDQLLPQIAETRKEKVLRIWSAACSTGQEAYSLAMGFRRDPERWAGWRIQILGTDISSFAVSRARAGVYAQMDVQRGLAINDLLHWFTPENDQWRISDDLRTMVDFRIDNLFECRVPVGSYDLILCRNVLLYFTPEMRKQVFARLARFSAPGGYLLLGAGETVIGQTEDYAPSSQFRGFYERVDARAAAKTCDRSARASAQPIRTAVPIPPFSSFRAK